MEVVVLLAFVGLLLVFGALLLFGHSHASRDYEHADRLALLALADDTAPRAPAAARAESAFTSRPGREAASTTTGHGK